MEYIKHIFDFKGQVFYIYYTMQQLTDYSTEILPILNKVSIDSKIETLELVLTYLEQTNRNIITLEYCISIIKSLKDNYKRLG
jgi:hypothetical protein